MLLGRRAARDRAGVFVVLARLRLATIARFWVSRGQRVSDLGPARPRGENPTTAGRVHGLRAPLGRTRAMGWMGPRLRWASLLALLGPGWWRA